MEDRRRLGKRESEGEGGITLKNLRKYLHKVLFVETDIETRIAFDISRLTVTAADATGV